MQLSFQARTTMGSNETQLRPFCAQCTSFCGDANDLEELLHGLTSLSSGYGSVRSDDGICMRHDRFVGARSWCADYSSAAPSKSANIG
jgi:hypothetical protein